MKKQTVHPWGMRLIRGIHALLNGVVLISALCLAAFSGYVLWDTQQLYQAADVKNYAPYKPTVKEQVSFQALQALNPEVIGWVTIFGTQIDYPITQGTDNLKYVDTNAKGEYALSGSIFLDYQNDCHFQDFNSILYGHHMEKQAMFGDLQRFTEADFFQSHRYGNLFFDGYDWGLEFVLFYQTTAYDRLSFTPAIRDEVVQAEYLQHLQEQALFQRSEITLSRGDRFLIFTTCALEQTNGRDMLVARIMDRTVTNPFVEKKRFSDQVVDKIWQYRWRWGLLFLIGAVGAIWLRSRWKNKSSSR